uniref:Transposase n=1 Tax=Globodera pallida TaxID=36090 RepID=A0A183CDH3_GLOPA
MEFDRISDKEEFDNGKDGEKQSTDSIFDNSNLKESSSKSQKGIKKIYSEVEKQEIIADWKSQFGVSKKQKKYTDAKKVELLKNFNKTKKENPQLRNDEIAQMLNIHIKTLNRWERKLKGLKPEKRMKYTDAEKEIKRTKTW